MPRGKATKKNKLKNDQTALTTMLMQISLKTDDHIYYNKRISASAAEDYLQELTSLELKCPRRDVRALQVIEKLRRLMKTIITDDHDMHVDHSPNTQADTHYTQTSSPVYSLPDEDRSENFTNTFVADAPTTDIAENNNKMNNIHQDKVIEKVNDALSNMAIRDDFVIAQTMMTDDKCSQSILVNYQDGSTELNKTYREMDIDIVHTSIINLDAQTECLNDININNQQASQRKDVDVVENDNKTIVIAEIHNSYTMINPVVSQPTPLTEKPQNNLNKHIPKKGNINKKSLKINIIEETQVQTGKGKKKKIVRKRKDKENDGNPKKRKTKATVNNNDEATDIMNKQNYHQEQKTKNVANSHNTEFDVKPVFKIYNSNVENDLSWVENLRYVREVSPQENDPTLKILEENFWDNFSLPNNWNDQDFKF